VIIRLDVCPAKSSTYNRLKNGAHTIFIPSFSDKWRLLLPGDIERGREEGGKVGQQTNINANREAFFRRTNRVQKWHK